VKLVRNKEVPKHHHHNGAGSEHRRIDDDSGGDGSDRNGAVEPAAGLLLHAATVAHDPALCHQLLLHRAPEVPLRRPAVGGLSVEPQNPRRCWLVHCPSSPDLDSAVDLFANACKSFPSSLVDRCFAFCPKKTQSCFFFSISHFLGDVDIFRLESGYESMDGKFDC